MLLICGGLGSIAIIGFLTHFVELSPYDGRCRFGLPSKVLLTLMSIEIGVNLLLTSVFLWIAKRILFCQRTHSSSELAGANIVGKLRVGGAKRTGKWSGSQYFQPQGSAPNENTRSFLWKCIAGSTLVMLSTMANLIQFYILDARELGWVCLTVCTLDSTNPNHDNLNTSG
jgi:hypothetical protein